MSDSSSKRALLGFDDDEEDAVAEVKEVRPTKLPKMLYKPQEFRKYEPELNDDLHDTETLDVAGDYLRMPIVEDQTSRAQRLSSSRPKEEDPKEVKRDTITRLRTSLFGQSIDEPEGPVLRSLPIRPLKSQGLSIMEKMGFKVGEALGKDPENKEALLEPIVVLPRTHKIGIRETTTASGSAVSDEPSNGMTESDELDFKRRLQLEKDEQSKLRTLKKMQRLCFELTHDNADVMSINPIDLNVMWRSYATEVQEAWKKKKKKKKTSDLQCDPETTNEDEEDGGDIDEELQLFEEEPIDEKIERLYLHLRAEFNYCFWCGARYEDQEDLLANCPGETQNDHL